jgi:hypothetical protein
MDGDGQPPFSTRPSILQLVLVPMCMVRVNAHANRVYVNATVPLSLPFPMLFSIHFLEGEATTLPGGPRQFALGPPQEIYLSLGGRRA